jgi:hypothetical protein
VELGTLRGYVEAVWSGRGRFRGDMESAFAFEQPSRVRRG